jgi:predicted transcriptional regulator
MGGQAQVLSSDVGRAIGVSTQRADEILREAIQRGFIEPRAHASWRCKL